MSEGPRIGYVVSRFPQVTQTFIVRELDAVAGSERLDVSLLALFPSSEEVVHHRARPWMPGVRRVTWLAGLRSLGWWAVRKPVTVAQAIAWIVAAHARRPGVLVRALATLLVSADHARALGPLGVEHLHGHFGTYPALCGWICRRLTGVTYSFTVHAHDLFIHQLGLARKARDAAFVVAISEFNARRLGELTSGEARVHVVHCGVDADAYAFRPRRLPHEGPVRGLCVASLEEYKGHEFLLRAMALDRPGVERLRMTFVGAGSRRQQLEQLVAELGLGDRVTFAGGRREDEVRALLDEAELFVLPSVVGADGDMEGIPIALMEAMASGIPVVTTRLSGIPELVRDGETGILAEPAEPESLARALAGTLADPDAAEQRTHRARAVVEAEFALQRSADELVELFLRASGTASSASPQRRTVSAGRSR